MADQTMLISNNQVQIDQRRFRLPIKLQNLRQKNSFSGHDLPLRVFRLSWPRRSFADLLRGLF